jgi:uncharacterized membrane protein (UPF0127 family)
LSRFVPALVVLVALAASGCREAGAAPEDATWAIAMTPSGEEFTLELADTPRKQRLGYMFRERIGPREGMLFLFDDVDTHSIWMKNCVVPLDILWLDEGFRVLHQVRDARPCPPAGPCPSMVPPMTSRYVLELSAGAAASASIENGDRLVVLWQKAGA